MGEKLFFFSLIFSVGILIGSIVMLGSDDADRKKFTCQKHQWVYDQDLNACLDSSDNVKFDFNHS